MEDDLNRRRKELSYVYILNISKMDSMEDDLNGRQPQWKTTSMEDDLNGF